MNPLSDSSTCIDLVTRFYRHLDRREYAGMVALMARDGTYQRPSGKIFPAGPTLIADLGTGSQTPLQAHLMTNVLVDFIDDHAVVQAYMTVFEHDSGVAPVLPHPLGIPKSIRSVQVKLHRREGDWRIWQLSNVLLFRNPQFQ